MLSRVGSVLPQNYGRCGVRERTAVVSGTAGAGTGAGSPGGRMKSSSVDPSGLSGIIKLARLARGGLVEGKRPTMKQAQNLRRRGENIIADDQKTVRRIEDGAFRKDPTAGDLMTLFAQELTSAAPARRMRLTELSQPHFSPSGIPQT